MNQTQKFRLRFLMVMLGLTTAACTQTFQTSGTLSTSLSSSVGCESFESRFWDSMNKFVESNQRLPSEVELKKAFIEGAKKSKRFESVTEKSIDRMSDGLINLHKSILLAVGDFQQPQGTNKTQAQQTSNTTNILETLAGLEIGDQTEPAKKENLTKVRKAFSEFSKLMELENLTKTGCQALGTPPPVPAIHGALIENFKFTRDPVVYGALKAMHVLYQSCDSSLRSPLDASTRPVAGITTLGRHPSGIGFVRKVTNINAFLTDHPYYDPYVQPDSICNSIKKFPMIYDYGGKPATTANNDYWIDFFSNAGSGSSNLGVDCSGYVFTALAASGRKIKSSTPLKARFVNGVNAKMYMDPEANGLDCLSAASYNATDSLLPGDIVAIDGHVNLIESVGADPFGIKNVNSITQCKVSNFSTAQFDFTILQSAPEFGGIGVYKVKAKDYLTDTSTMGRGLIESAVQACKARFGKPTLAPKTTAAVVRHKETAACIDQEAQLAGQECIVDCQL